MRRVISILFSLLLILANASISVATHYCCGKAVMTKVSLGTQVLSCGMNEEDHRECNYHDKCLFDQSKCCDNENIQFQIEDEYSCQSEFSMSEIATSYSVRNSTCNSNFFTKFFGLKNRFQTSLPPPLKQNKSVLVQCFLL